MTKKQEPRSEQARKVVDDAHLHRNLTDLELGLYVRGGSIIPMLDHSRELSLLRALHNPISLHVYMDRDSSADGKLMLDDGLSTKPDKLVSTFKYNETHSSGTLRHEISESTYTTDKLISEITFYGVTR